MVKKQHKDSAQLQHRIVEVSSEDPQHPASELDKYNTEGTGWQSAHGCEFPQEVVLQLLPGQPSNCTIFLNQIQILSHESKIAQKIEVFVASGKEGGAQQRPTSIDHCTSVRRLGFVSLDSNERSSYQARELKSVNLGEEEVTFVKLLLHQCHHNELNAHNQVSIVGVNFFGRFLCQDQQGETNSIISKRRQQNSHKDGKMDILNRKGEASEHNEDCTVEIRLNALERAKQWLASKEDFDTAAKIKSGLDKAKSMFESLEEIKVNMKKAAAEEEYAEASLLKAERDSAHVAAFDALGVVEMIVADSGFNDVPLTDLALPTITGGFNYPRLTPSDANGCQRDNQLHQSNRDNKIVSSERTSDIDQDSESQDSMSVTNEIQSASQIFDGNNHPLEGIPDYLDLPSPEEINDDGVNVSPDQIQKVESMLGRYVTRCVFSRNWSLREAGLTKASLLLRGILDEMDPQLFAKNILSLLERAIDDRIVQVFVAGLLLLDDCIEAFEKEKMSLRDVSSLLTKIMTSLVGKLGDSKAKVVDGAETELMSMALSPCVGAPYVSNQVMKRICPRDLKSGRAICARFKFLKKVLEEFGEEFGEGGGIMAFMTFVKEYGYGHKDADVRNAAREIATTVYLLIGDNILPMLEGLSDRQVREYKASFTQAVSMDSGRVESYPSIDAEKYPRHTLDEAIQNRSMPTMKPLQTQPGRGRGRGRRRVNHDHTFNGIKRGSNNEGECDDRYGDNVIQISATSG